MTLWMDTGLEGKVVVTTGAARGIGEAIVAGLLASGARVVGLDRSWGDSHGSMRDANLLRLTADVTDDGQLQEAFDATMSAFGTVDVVINNAAYRQRDVIASTRTSVIGLPLAEWMKMLDVNVLGPLRVIQAFAAPLLANRQGAIINVSSPAGQRGVGGNQPYAASKAALTNWSQSLAEELRSDGISVNIVFPGATQTTGFDQVASGTHYRGTFWRADSVVTLVLFLAAQDVTVTGRTFDVRQWNVEHGLGGDEVWAVEALGERMPGFGAP